MGSDTHGLMASKRVVRHRYDRSTGGGVQIGCADGELAPILVRVSVAWYHIYRLSDNDRRMVFAHCIGAFGGLTAACTCRLGPLSFPSNCTFRACRCSHLEHLIYVIIVQVYHHMIVCSKMATVCVTLSSCPPGQRTAGGPVRAPYGAFDWCIG